MTDQTTERVLDWDDEIENDSNSDFITLPGGDYDFTVVGFERERYAGGDKLPPCNKAVIEIRIDGGSLGSTTIRENLFLHSKTEGILCAFFTSIGQRQHGEKTKMNWGTVTGSTGRATFGIREYDKKLDDGSIEKRTINQVKRWLDPAKGEQTAAFTPGKF